MIEVDDYRDFPPEGQPVRKKSKKSPTQRSLERLRRAGAMAATVERWNPYAQVRQDLFGFADVLAIDDAPGCLAIQATTADNSGHRLAKFKGSEVAAKIKRFLAAGNRLEIHGWRLGGKQGKRKTWLCNIVKVTEEMLT